MSARDKVITDTETWTVRTERARFWGCWWAHILYIGEDGASAQPAYKIRAFGRTRAERAATAVVLTRTRRGEPIEGGGIVRSTGTCVIRVERVGGETR